MRPLDLPDSVKRGMYVCVRSARLLDGTVVGEVVFYGTESDCETIACDEPPMTGLDRALIAEEVWKVTTVQHWEHLQNGKA